MVSEKSVIVSKFYSNLEKLGFKKHNVSQEEVNYLESLPELEQLSLLNNESDFNLNRLKIKMIISLISSLSLFLVALIGFFVINSIWFMLPFFLGSIVCLISYKRYKTKMEIQSIEKQILKHIKKDIIDRTFR